MRDLVHIRFSKWPGIAHWHYDLEWLDEDEYGTWLFAPTGTIAQRGEEAPIPMSYPFVKLVPRDAWYAAIWNGGGKYDVYVDVCTPAKWSDRTVEMVDLDLDVVRYREDEETAVLDEDEFLEHQIAFGYPEHVVDRARASAAKLVVALDSRREPFGDVGAERLKTALRTEHGLDG